MERKNAVCSSVGHRQRARAEEIVKHCQLEIFRKLLVRFFIFKSKTFVTFSTPF